MFLFYIFFHIYPIANVQKNIITSKQLDYDFL